MRAAVSYIENHSAKINTNTNAVWCQTGPGRYFPSSEFASVGCRLLSRLALGNHFDAVSHCGWTVIEATSKPNASTIRELDEYVHKICTRGLGLELNF